MEVTMRGLVYPFRPENGFGYAELEDGREVLFDVTACLAEPAEGQAVRVVLGPRAAGKPKVLRVEPEDQPDSTRPVTTLEDAIKRLQSEGIALELGPSALGVIVGDHSLPSLPSSVPQVLAAYYAHPELGPNRALSDRFLFVDRLEDPDAALRDLLEAEPEGNVSSEHPAPRERVESAVDAVNQRLYLDGDARRFLLLHGAPGALCMALGRARRLADVWALPIDWDRPHLQALRARA